MIKGNVRIVLKVIDKNQIGVIGNGGDAPRLPTLSIDESFGDLLNHIKTLLDRFEIPTSWLKLNQMPTVFYDNTVYINYTSFVPKDFLNDQTISKITYDFNKFAIEDQVQIREALSLHNV